MEKTLTRIARICTNFQSVKLVRGGRKAQRLEVERAGDNVD
jgi:hypothetical protein